MGMGRGIADKHTRGKDPDTYTMDIASLNFMAIGRATEKSAKKKCKCDNMVAFHSPSARIATNELGIVLFTGRKLPNHSIT